MQYYTILFYTLLYFTLLYYTVLYYTILYYSFLYSMLYYTIYILYYTNLYYIYYTIPVQWLVAASITWNIGQEIASEPLSPELQPVKILKDPALKGGVWEG